MSLDQFKEILNAAMKLSSEKRENLIEEATKARDRAEEDLKLLKMLFERAPYDSDGPFLTTLPKPATKRVPKAKKKLTTVVTKKKRKSPEPVDGNTLNSIHNAIFTGTNTFKEVLKLYPKMGKNRLRVFVRRLMNDNKIVFEGYGEHGKYVSLKAPIKSL